MSFVVNVYRRPGIFTCRWDMTTGPGAPSVCPKCPKHPGGAGLQELLNGEEEYDNHLYEWDK